LGFVFKDGEEVEKADHFECLDGEFGWLEQPDGAASLLGGGEMANEHADATRIDGGNGFEIEDDPRVSMAEQFVHGGIEPIEGGPHAQASIERDDFHRIHCFRVDIQRSQPPGGRGKFQHAALTPQYGFVRVRGQLR